MGVSIISTAYAIFRIQSRLSYELFLVTVDSIFIFK